MRVAIRMTHGDDNSGELFRLKEHFPRVIVANWLWDNHVSHVHKLRTTIAAATSREPRRCGSTPTRKARRASCGRDRDRPGARRRQPAGAVSVAATQAGKLERSWRRESLPIRVPRQTRQSGLAAGESVNRGDCDAVPGRLPPPTGKMRQSAWRGALRQSAWQRHLRRSMQWMERRFPVPSQCFPITQCQRGFVGAATRGRAPCHSSRGSCDVSYLGVSDDPHLPRTRRRNGE